MLSTGQLAFTFGPAGSPPPPQTQRPPPVLSLLRQRLLAAYGRPRTVERPDPLDQFVSGIISTRTREDIAFPTFKRLRYQFKSWEAVSHAPAGEIERIIRPVTHAERKAAQIPEALRLIGARSGGLDLRFLADWPEMAAMAWLMDLPGAGHQIAATTLAFSTLRKRVLPVDTQLLRVGKRLGLLPDNADYGRSYEIFRHLVPDDWDADDIGEFHGLMKLHGQRVCVYDSPACFRCPLRAFCSRGTTRH